MREDTGKNIVINDNEWGYWSWVRTGVRILLSMIMGKDTDQWSWVRTRVRILLSLKVTTRVTGPDQDPTLLKKENWNIQIKPTCWKWNLKVLVKNCYSFGTFSCKSKKLFKSFGSLDPWKAKIGSGSNIKLYGYLVEE